MEAGLREDVVSEPQSVLLNSGYRVPMLGMGTYKITDPDVICKALELGYRHLDCEWLGQGVKGPFFPGSNRSMRHNPDAAQ